MLVYYPRRRSALQWPSDSSASPGYSVRASWIVTITLAPVQSASRLVGQIRRSQVAPERSVQARVPNNSLKPVTQTLKAYGRDRLDWRLIQVRAADRFEVIRAVLGVRNRATACRSGRCPPPPDTAMTASADQTLAPAPKRPPVLRRPAPDTLHHCRPAAGHRRSISASAARLGYAASWA